MDFYEYTEDTNDLDASATQKILAEILGGKRKPRFVRIYTHAKLDTVASHAAGRRVYNEAPYIIAKYSRTDDGISRPLTEQDKADYPREWQRYESTLAAASDPDVGLLPACTVAAQRELADMGITRISAVLARADEVPAHLSDVVKQAQMWEALNNPSEEESQ